MSYTDGGISRFLGEEDQKLQIEEMGVRYKFSCFKDKLMESCYSLGQWYEVYKEDAVKAAETFKSTCEEHHHPEACMKYANYLLRGTGVEKDPVTAFKIYEKNCLENNHDKSCFAAGVMCSKGVVSHKQNRKRAYILFKKSCDLNFPSGCHQMGIHSLLQQINGKFQTEVGIKYLNKACDLGHFRACVDLGNMYKNGIFLAKDEDKSQEYLKRAQDNLHRHSPWIHGEMQRKK